MSTPRRPAPRSSAAPMIVALLPTAREATWSLEQQHESDREEDGQGGRHPQRMTGTPLGYEGHRREPEEDGERDHGRCEQEHHEPPSEWAGRGARSGRRSDAPIAAARTARITSSET